MWSLDELTPDLSDPQERALSVPGIGAGVLRVIEEFRADGRIELLDQLGALYPAHVARIRRLSRMTPAILRSLKGELGVETVGDLVAAVETGGVEALRGVGPATAERWARTLGLAPAPDAIPAFQAWTLAEALCRHLRRHLGGPVEAAGSVRTMEEWVESVELVAGVVDARSGQRFLEATSVARFVGSSPTGETRLRAHEGVKIAVHLVPPAHVETRLFQVTGPVSHVNELLAVSDDPALTESEIYAGSGREWVPPPARGFADATAAGVVRLGEIRGDLHLHTNRSPDGRLSLDEILLEAVDRGYEYVLITDHTSGLRFGGLDEEALEAQRADIDEARSRFPDLLVLHGAELNIGPDGSLDIDDDALALLDMAVAGLHSHFDLGRAEQTNRVVAAMRNPVVRILAHPTGRRLGTRPAIELDMEAVVSNAVENWVALEVNGHRDRLDLSAALTSHAVSSGAMLAANSDAHRIGEMGNIANAVATIQRAGIRPDSIVNTMPVGTFRAWLSRSGAGFRVRAGG